MKDNQTDTQTEERDPFISLWNTVRSDLYRHAGHPSLDRPLDHQPNANPNANLEEIRRQIELYEREFCQTLTTQDPEIQRYQESDGSRQTAKLDPLEYQKSFAAGQTAKLDPLELENVLAQETKGERHKSLNNYRDAASTSYRQTVNRATSNPYQQTVNQAPKTLNSTNAPLPTAGDESSTPSYGASESTGKGLSTTEDESSTPPYGVFESTGKSLSTTEDESSTPPYGVFESTGKSSSTTGDESSTGSLKTGSSKKAKAEAYVTERGSETPIVWRDPHDIILIRRLLGGFLAQAFALVGITAICFYLVMRVPDRIVVDKSSGRVIQINNKDYGATEAVEMTPDRPGVADRIYLARQWAEWYFTVDRATRARSLERAFALMEPNARKQLARWLQESGELDRERAEARQATWKVQDITADRRDPYLIRIIGIQQITKLSSDSGNLQAQGVETVRRQLNVAVKLIPDPQGRDDRNLRTGYIIAWVDARPVGNEENVPPSAQVAPAQTQTQN